MAIKFAIIFVLVLGGLVLWMLIARKNPAVADEIRDAVDKAKDEAKKL